MGALLDISLKYLREDWLNSRFFFRLLAAPPDFSLGILSDNIDFDLCGYIPVSQPDLGETVTPQLPGLGMIELGYSLRPFTKSRSEAMSRFQIGVAERLYFRTYVTRVNWIETDPNSDSIFMGAETEFKAAWRIFSDLGVGFTGAFFIPGGAVLSDDILWSVGLELSISF